MEYISALEASEKWGISLRQVQRLLAGNRVPRAKKYGRSWMIPDDAEKPADPRQKPQYSLSNDLADVIAATTIPMPADNPDEILNIVSEERLRHLYEGELAYLRGDFQRTLRCFYETEGDDAARLRACPSAIAAAVSTRDYHAYTEIDTYLKRIKKTYENSSAAALAELSLATVAVSVIAPNLAPDWLKSGDFSALPVQTRPNAIYLRTKYLMCIGSYEAVLAAAQTTLTLSSTEHGITTTDIYLRVSCAVACRCLGQFDEAGRYLLDAMRIALPHGFITPFAEIATALGGLMDRCLEGEFPDYRDMVIRQWESTWKNWIDFHNRFTKDHITLMLSLREYQMAVLVARHVPYAKIAKQYCISVGRLKNIMLEVYEKLYVFEQG